MNQVYLYILVAMLTIYLIRMLPLTLIRKEIKNPFIKSFLYYVPYVTLAVMTFPAILSATGNSISAWAGFIAGVIIAYVDGNLFKVSLGACAVVFIVNLFV
ncbi:MAG: AzlD domain-containing protein [Lachnospiraceae bacterium]|nr:AzlD domain-containing protein [Lachnospiraceae bacterium]